ncbi:MAG: MOSC domain-containing protein [Gemmatimonadota bacterium]|nr:MOSC domain-containing protein [Gemmatimonadota bacterium]
MLRVAALFRYPLKSAAGQRCNSLQLDRFGVQGDRRWMIISAEGLPITQREIPSLALLRARAEADSLTLTWGGSAPAMLRVAIPGADSPRVAVTIWDDSVRLSSADSDAAQWLSTRLGREARLAYMPDDVERPVNPRYARSSDRTALTDGYPLHLIGSGSLQDLNRRLANPIGVERFRPNVYVEGPEPFSEDTWRRIRIGECGFRVVKPCPRCSVTTVDPETGERGKEPLRTLTRYRKREGGVMFGQNVIHDGSGEIRVGDQVQVLSRRDAPAT